jgi:CheY-like chemotaxis protein
MLEADGHAVHVASDPEDALRIWAEHGRVIDLVICDVAMAQQRGPELAARLATEGRLARVSFITGYSNEAVRSELQHAVLAKPFTAAKLAAAICEVVRRRKGEPPESKLTRRERRHVERPVRARRPFSELRYWLK